MISDIGMFTVEFLEFHNSYVKQFIITNKIDRFVAHNLG